MFKARPKQEEVLLYRGGKMGVSAVPGSGKTLTLSYLAAKLIKEKIKNEEEILVVTLVNSAVENFAARVSSFVQFLGLLPHMNYIVRTLHGLAHDIVRERPSLAGLSEDFQIIDEKEGEEILRDVAIKWSLKNTHIFEFFLNPHIDFNEDSVKRDLWPELVINIASDFIKRAKDFQKTPGEIRKKLDGLKGNFPLAEMGLAIYEDYNRSLSLRGAVDFDDLIRLAHRVLELDRDYLERLRKKWVFVLEDEAQDSSRLQEKILRLLTGDRGNWVRVGDPNQAIYETFTTANPYYLRNFLKEPGVISRELPDSGRSTSGIIDLANYLILWTGNFHPVRELRDSLTIPLIELTSAGDPQPNPKSRGEDIHMITENFTAEEEINYVVNSLSKWLPGHSQETVAVLVPRNKIGANLVKGLKKRNIDYVELLKSTKTTRETAGALTYILRYLASPASSHSLAMAYKVWRRDDREDELLYERLEEAVGLIKTCKNIEDFLWPRLKKNWLEEEDIKNKYSHLYEYLLEFRTLVRRWQMAGGLPADQLILTVAQDLFPDPADLAIAHKLAVLTGQLKESHPEWSLPEIASEFKKIANNQRKFHGLTQEERGFEPENYRGKVVITTVHRAKGLEWDRVYLMSVNNYDFPSAMASDIFISEKWFIRDRLNLQAEAQGQLEALLYPEKFEYREGEETKKGRLDYAGERIRLLYVGITRARRELIVTWNSGKKRELKPSVPFIALSNYLKERNYENTR